MRPAVLVLAITLAACGSARSVDRDDEPLENPFVVSADFEPTSFSVDVVGEGRPIIYIPGLGCPGEVWDATAEHFRDKYESHILTLAGFAGTTPIDKPLSATVRKELTRYIRSRRLDDPVIVGHSMGGFIAFWLAVEHPDNLGPIVIVDAGPALSGDLEDAQRLRARWAQASDDEFERQARAMYDGMAKNREALAPIAAKAARSDRRALGDAIYEMMVTDLTPRMGEIRSPVLLVLANGAFRQRIMNQVKAIPDHDVVVLETGHFVMLDDPEGWFRTLDEFLELYPP